MGFFAFAVILAFHNITDGDLWAKLAIGESFWEHGHIPRHNVVAFTPVLPEYIDHEWGSGVVFYGLLKWFGPSALMLLKMLLAFGALAFALAAGRKENTSLNVLLLMALPAAACLLPGYIPVVRCHAFTYFLFAATVLCLETLRAGSRWPAVMLPFIMLTWTNLHGGFVVGLAAVFLYAVGAVFTRQNARLFIGVAMACAAVTFINPYGVKFWQYLIPALLNPRPRVAEWRPLPVLAWDDFLGFRVLFVLTVAAVAVAWKLVTARNWRGLALLALTAFMGWRSRRHGAFFAVAALAFAGPYWWAALARLPGGIRARVRPAWGVGVFYLAIALYAAETRLPGASLHPLAPIGEDPVREADILARADAKGNLATPFGWGSYLAWRLAPSIKISMDGRYETAYPESTDEMNYNFFHHSGNWFRLCRDYRVDFVILDLMREPLRPEDLTARGYVLVWKQDNISALLCLPEHAAVLQKAAANLPPNTIDPLVIGSRPW